MCILQRIKVKLLLHSKQKLAHVIIITITNNNVKLYVD